MVGQASSPDIMMTSGDACLTNEGSLKVAAFGSLIYESKVLRDLQIIILGNTNSSCRIQQQSVLSALPFYCPDPCRNAKSLDAICTYRKRAKWSLTKTVFITSIAGLGHSVATCVLGSIIALIGLRISKYAETVAEPIAACILIVLGIVFVVFGRLRPCKHDHNL